MSNVQKPKTNNLVNTKARKALEILVTFEPELYMDLIEGKLNSSGKRTGILDILDKFYNDYYKYFNIKPNSTDFSNPKYKDADMFKFNSRQLKSLKEFRDMYLEINKYRTDKK